MSLSTVLSSVTLVEVCIGRANRGTRRILGDKNRGTSPFFSKAWTASRQYFDFSWEVKLTCSLLQYSGFTRINNYDTREPCKRQNISLPLIETGMLLTYHMLKLNWLSHWDQLHVMIDNSTYYIDRTQYEQGGAAFCSLVDRGYQQANRCTFANICATTRAIFEGVGGVHTQQVGAPSTLFIVTQNHLPK